MASPLPRSFEVIRADVTHLSSIDQVSQPQIQIDIYCESRRLTYRVSQSLEIACISIGL